jgi:uncharacterized RDD family membrane protein YckC
MSGALAMKLQICGHCQHQFPANALFCPSCGKGMKTHSGAQGSAQPPRSRFPAHFSGSWQGSLPETAAMWRRVLALGVDGMIIAGIGILASKLLPIVGALLVTWLYFALCESSSMQGTVGKRLLKLKVLDVNGVRLQFGRATLRFFCRFLSALPLGAGYLYAFFNPARQTLHDLLASTRVVAR